MILALAIAAVPSFVASIVEWVEAFTIVLAVGNTRGWRSPIWGTAAGLATLAVIVGVFGTPLIIFHEQVAQSFHIVVGILLLLFILAGVCLTSLVAVRMLALIAPQGARVVVRNI